MSIYQRIDETRKAQGVTWAHLNELIGGYRGKLTEVKNGKTTLTKIELGIIAVALHVSTDYLLGNTDDPRPIQELAEEGQQKKPTPQDESELIPGYNDLSEENKAKTRDFIAFLLSQQ